MTYKVKVERDKLVPAGILRVLVSINPATGGVPVAFVEIHAEGPTALPHPE
jgi:hypothetical protein